MRKLNAVCVLLFPLAAHAQPDYDPRIQDSLIVRSVTIGKTGPLTPAAVPVNAELYNASPRSIYAFKIECTSTYGDGSTSINRVGVDLLANYVFELKDPAFTPRPNMLLRPSETYKGGVSAFLAKDGTVPISASCVVTTLVFDDRTALGDHKTVQEIVDGRLALYAQYAGVVSDMKSVVETNDPIQAMEKRRDELLKRRPEDPDVRGPSGQRLSPNSARAQWLETLVRGNTHEVNRSMIRTAISDFQMYADALKLHATLRELQQ
jgi:hypothetical protein